MSNFLPFRLRVSCPLGSAAVVQEAQEENDSVSETEGRSGDWTVEPTLPCEERRELKVGSVPPPRSNLMKGEMFLIVARPRPETLCRSSTERYMPPSGRCLRKASTCLSDNTWNDGQLFPRASVDTHWRQGQAGHLGLIMTSDGSLMFLPFGCLLLLRHV